MLVPVRYVSLPEVQRQLWFAAQVSRNPSGYLVPVQLRIDGPLDLDRLDRAIRAVVTRHEVLRTGTALVGDELVGVVHEVPCPAFGLDEIATDANADADADVTAWL
ncbi:MAG TPA: condensation domain-containing protein, partial [Mycobacteriales bacterium]